MKNQYPMVGENGDYDERVIHPPSLEEFVSQQEGNNNISSTIALFQNSTKLTLMINTGHPRKHDLLSELTT